MIRRIAIALAGCLFMVSATGAEEARKRIVAAGGDVVAIIHLLGRSGDLIAVDDGATWPDMVATLPRTGYFRRLSAEGLLMLEPDYLVVNANAGPTSTLDLLEDAGVRVVRAPDSQALADIPAKIRKIGVAIGEAEAAEELAVTFERDLRELVGATQAIENKPRVLFILAIREGAPLVGGEGTAPDMVIRAAGGLNAAAEISGFKPMSREALVAARPDFILMTNSHSASFGGLEQVLARPDVGVTPAGKNKSGSTMDTFMLLGLGPRAVLAARELASELHSAETLKKLGF